MTDQPTCGACTETESLDGGPMKCEPCMTLEAHLPVYLADPANRERVRRVLDGFRERTSVERVKFLYREGYWRPWQLESSLEVERAVAQYADALVWEQVRIDLKQHLCEAQELLTLSIPRNESGNRIRAARDEALDALRSRVGWSCKEEDLEAETEARYLEATGQL